MGRGQLVDGWRPPPSSPSPAADGRLGRRQSSVHERLAPPLPRAPAAGAAACAQWPAAWIRLLPVLPLPTADPRATAVDGAASAAPPRPEQGQPRWRGQQQLRPASGSFGAELGADPPRLELPGDTSRLGSGGQISGSVLVGEREKADGWAWFLQGQRRPFLCCGVLETKIKDWSVLCKISKSGVCCAQNHHLGMCHSTILQTCHFFNLYYAYVEY